MLKRYLYFRVHSSIIYNSKDIETTQGKRSYGVYIYNIIQPQKWENSANQDNMDGPQRHYPKWNNSEEDKYYMIMWTLKHTDWLIGEKKKERDQICDHQK